MSNAIYLSPKAANRPAFIFIKINRHNASGWIEKPNGQAVKLYQPQRNLNNQQ